MKTDAIVAVIAAVALAAVAAVALQKKTASEPGRVAGMYCSSDGTLTDTMPIQSHRSYCVKPATPDSKYSANAPAEYSFTIVDDRGETLKEFAVTHTKLMHVIVVRKDLRYFQHLHPEFDQSTGRFTLGDLTFPADGMYRIFADFAPAKGMMDPMGAPLPVTAWDDVAVGLGAYVPDAFGSEERKKTFADMAVEVSADPDPPVAGSETLLSFDLRANDKPVTDLQEYLGALGHSVILREDTLDFIHAHPVDEAGAPQDGKVDFAVYFPEAGTYKSFTQFQRDGQVVTTDFVLTVAAGEEGTSADTEMHSGH